MEMTQDASVGPVLVIATHPDPSRAIKSYTIPKNHQLIQKSKRYEKKHLEQKTTHNTSFAPVLTVADDQNPPL